MSNPDAFGPLVSAAWLREHLRDPDLRVIDMRWYLAAKRGADEYLKGHVPGAVFVDLERDLTPPRGPGRHPIPPPALFEAAMRRAGVSSNTRVVAYDDAGGSIAARLWWLLRYYGHDAVAVLDGGIAAWVAEGGALERQTPVLTHGDWSAATPRAEWVVDKAYVDAARRACRALLLDARAPERYRGESEPVDARPGHIPGASSAPWMGNLREGSFLSPDELRARYEALGATGGREVIAYCGSGVTACHNLLAMEIAGIRGAKLYEGSWSDWARDASLPAAKGEE